MNFLDLKSGKSVEDEKIPVYKSDAKGNKYIYLIAGVHGDEVEGVYVLKKLFEWLKEAEQIDLPLIVIPILNVDGFRANTRVNSNGVDLNRNYPSKNWTDKYTQENHYPGKEALSEPENKFLIKLFNKFKPGLIISFHSWKALLNYNGKCLDIAELLEKFNQYPIVGEFTDHPTPGSLGELAPEKYNSPVLTFECPLLKDGKSLNDIWVENKDGLYKLMESKIIASKID